MAGAICRDCASNVHLKALIEREDVELSCTHCGEMKRPAISAESIASYIEPIMREHFEPATFDDGQPLLGLVYEMVDQELEFVEEVIDEIIALDPADPRDGDESLWDAHTYYVETRTGSWNMRSRWDRALAELKHARRFFSPSAGDLFAELFSDVDQLRYWEKGESENGWKPVVFELPPGTTLFRARACNSSSQRAAFFKSPLKELGPPPPAAARAGRMNAEGVAVLYCALAADTAVAEMRPAIGMELILAAFQTTKPLRILDFSRLEEAHGDVLSYLQPDFNQQVERNHFLRRLHTLITRPVVPGREADYLITQTMAEFLSHVVARPFQGVFFRSAQHADGTNVVLFGNFASELLEAHDTFPISYVEGSLSVHEVTAVGYSHRQLGAYVSDDGDVSVYDLAQEDYPDDE